MMRDQAGALPEVLEEMAYRIRRLSMEMITFSRWGHPGGSLSAADILAVLYFDVMTVDPARPDWEQRDRFVCSKAHAAPAVYAALALRGFFPVEEIYTYCELGGRLEGHVHRGGLPGIEIIGRAAWHRPLGGHRHGPGPALQGAAAPAGLLPARRWGDAMRAMSGKRPWPPRTTTWTT